MKPPLMNKEVMVKSVSMLTRKLLKVVMEVKMMMEVTTNEIAEQCRPTMTMVTTDNNVLIPSKKEAKTLCDTCQIIR